MIGGTRSSAMPAPFKAPTAPPQTRISGTAQSSAASLLRVIAVVITAAQFSIQGTDRSIPPPMMTKVCPMATMPVNEATTISVPMCLGDAKPGE